jgi:plastocyanin
MRLSVDRMTTPAFFLLVGIATLVSTSTLLATTHLIQFGGSFGLSYSPNTLTVSVGDTIRWQGAFSLHPLSSTAIPAGAQTWTNSTGTAFTYVVQIPGTYTYQCDVHAPGMSGSFTAGAATGVNDEPRQSQPSTIHLDQNYPNPFNPSTRITYSLAQNSSVSLKLFNVMGEEVATLVKGFQTSGIHDVSFDGTGLPTGTYLYCLEAGGSVATKRLVLVK